MELSTNRDLDIKSRPDIEAINRNHHFLKDLYIPSTDKDIATLHNKLLSYKTYSNSYFEF